MIPEMCSLNILFAHAEIHLRKREVITGGTGTEGEVDNKANWYKG